MNRVRFLIVLSFLLINFNQFQAASGNSLGSDRAKNISPLNFNFELCVPNSSRGFSPRSLTLSPECLLELMQDDCPIAFSPVQKYVDLSKDDLAVLEVLVSDKLQQCMGPDGVGRFSGFYKPQKDVEGLGHNIKDNVESLDCCQGDSAILDGHESLSWIYFVSQDRLEKRFIPVQATLWFDPTNHRWIYRQNLLKDPCVVSDFCGDVDEEN